MVDHSVFKWRVDPVGYPILHVVHHVFFGMLCMNDDVWFMLALFAKKKLDTCLVSSMGFIVCSKVIAPCYCFQCMYHTVIILFLAKTLSIENM